VVDDAVSEGIDGDFGARAQELTRQITAGLTAAAPPAWHSLEANFAMTVATQVGIVRYTVGDQVSQVDPAAPVIVLVRRLRETLAATGEAPWWRMIIRVRAGGEADIRYDFGERRFPTEQLLPPAAYREDLDAYPRDRVPAWLSSYISGDETPAGVKTTVEDEPETETGRLAQLPRDEAITRVREYIVDRGMDTTGYPLSKLVADRFSCGWLVYVPVPKGEIAIGRALFYIADDGVLEPSSSSVAPRAFVVGFEQRFRDRQQAQV
jgi:hypothetical protein